MIEASTLKPGTVLQIDNELYSVVSIEHHVGRGQLRGTVTAAVKDLKTRHVRELRFHPEDKLDDVLLERRDVEFLYSDADAFYFMHPDSFEQFSLPRSAIGPHEKFLQPNMRMPVQLHEGAPVNIAFPLTVELRVVTAPPGLHDHDSGTYKTVTLENGLEVLAPQFIKEGDTVKVEVETGKYLERVRHETKRV